MLSGEIGKYKILKNLNNGHFGEVYLVHDQALNIQRAVKFLKFPDPKRFIEGFKEAQVQEKCRHQNTVDVKEADLIEINGEVFVYIAMEYLPKGSIQDLIEQRFIGVRETIRLMRDLLTGLEFAHNAGVIHKDIKPGNVLLDNNGNAKISDFGLSEDKSINKHANYAYQIHIPYEVFSGLTEPNALTDIYASGITMYRLINNYPSLTIPTNDRDEFIELLKLGKFPSKIYQPHIPFKIQKIIAKAIETDPKKRYQNVRLFRNALEDIKIGIDWHPLTPTKWIGKDKTENLFELEIIQKTKDFLCFAKKNNRKISILSSKANSIDEAETWMYEIIQKTTCDSFYHIA